MKRYASHKFNISEIARLAGVTRSQLSATLAGKMVMSRGLAAAIGQAFQINPGDLVFASPPELRQILFEALRRARAEAGPSS